MTRARCQSVRRVFHAASVCAQGMLSVCMSSPVAASLRGELETMRGSISLMVSITNDLLDLEKLRAGKLHVEHGRVALRDLVAKTVEEVQPATSVPMRAVIAPAAPETVRRAHAT